MAIDSDMTRQQMMTDTGSQQTDVQVLEFHRLARAASNHRWWKPLLVGTIAVAIYVVALLLLMVMLIISGFAFPGVDSVMDTFLQDSEVMDLSDPFSFALAMVMLTLMIPALFVATRLLAAKPVGLLSSVIGRLRMHWLAQCSFAAIIIYSVGFGVQFLIAAAQGERMELTLDMPRVAILVVLVIVLMPLQSAAEEYVFRGYFMQTIGGWLRHPAFAILLPVPLFVLGHGYGPLGMTDIAVFAVVAGWLTWRTGGLEAAMVMHIVNNVSLGILGAVGLVDVNATEVGVPDLAVSLLITVTFAFVVVRLAERQGVRRTAPRTMGLTALTSPVETTESADARR